MGIPSYYKKLCSTVNGLRSECSKEIDWFFMDFNCLIYHCLHRMGVYDGSNDWESQFIECIVVYCRKVIQQVAPKNGVYIAIDGVVPMAKMRQQRLRRFKSVWLKQNESAGGWDTNAITPGTVFMGKLRSRLEKMVEEHPTWKFSSSDEPGEGEHKIIAEWRKGIYKGNFAVYGLDADLILLSMLGRICCSLDNIWLFREEVQAGKIAYDAKGEELFEWFSIHTLHNWLCANQNATQFILHYCFAMSVLGNDFLPSSFSYKMRDDGHSALLSIIQEITQEGIIIIQPNTLDIMEDGLQILFKRLAVNDSERVLAYILKKQMFARNADQTELGENNWPLAHVEENIFMEKSRLHPQWKDKYRQLLGRSIREISDEYLQGIRWIWSYYTGKDVCYNWFYPFHLPPLWEWIDKLPVPTEILVRASDIRPVEQLALVLPLESWELIPSSPEKQFPHLAPQFYPSVFSFDSMGKRFFWECESMIPFPSIIELKGIIAAAATACAK